MADPINSGETWASIRAKINTAVAEMATAVSTIAGKLTASLNLSDLPDKAAARTALELGTMAQQNAGTVAISGGTISGLSAPLPIASGGTGGATQDAAQTALGASLLGKALFAAANPGAARTSLEVAAAVDTMLKSGNFAGLADVEAALGNLGFSTFARSLRTAADQAAFRTALGLGGLAVKNDVAFADLVTAAVRLSSGGLAAPTDAELATAAWAKAYADSILSRVLLAEKGPTSNNFDFMEFDHSAFKAYEFDIENYKPVGTEGLWLHLSTDGGATFINSAGAYRFVNDGLVTGGGRVTSTNASATFGNLITTLGNGALDEGVSGRVLMLRAGAVGARTRFVASLSGDGPGTSAIVQSTVVRNNAELNNGVRFSSFNGGAASGNIRLYGLR